MTRLLRNPGRPAALLTAAMMAAALLATQGAFARGPERAPTVSPPPRPGDPPILEGSLSPKMLLGVSPEWKEGFQAYQPDAADIEMIRSFTSAMKADLKVDVVVGTWCGDSRREVPRFMKVQRRLHRDRLPVEFWGVDRTKRNPPESTEGRNIERVPTFIVTYRGKELGRIVESPKVSLEADLAEILSTAGKSEG